MSDAPDSTPAELRLRLRQQELATRFGLFALEQDELQPVLDEACRVAAEGLETRFAKVMRWQPDAGDFLTAAGVGHLTPPPTKAGGQLHGVRGTGVLSRSAAPA